MLDHLRPDPLEQAPPIVAAEEDDGEVVDLLGLHQRQRLEELVEGAEATGEDDEGLGILDEHRLAHEEVAEVLGDVDVGIGAVLARQIDGQPHRDAVGLLGAAVGRLHDARTATGDDGEALVRELGRERPGLLIHGLIRLRASGAEDADGGAQAGERVEALDELAHDAQRAPGVRFEEGGVGDRSLHQQLAVVGRAVGAEVLASVGHRRRIRGPADMGRRCDGRRLDAWTTTPRPPASPSTLSAA